MADPMVLKAALAQIAGGLSDAQRSVLVLSWSRAQVFGDDVAPVVGDMQTARALARLRLADNKAGTAYYAQLNELGSAVAGLLVDRAVSGLTDAQKRGLLHPEELSGDSRTERELLRLEMVREPGGELTSLGQLVAKRLERSGTSD